MEKESINKTGNGKKILTSQKGKNFGNSEQHLENSSNSNNSVNQGAVNYARSPYNFVPLNDQVFYSKSQTVNFSKYDASKLTGYIDLLIENKTPLFIRGKNENFLLINGKPIIPGSSLRGLIRNMVGIVTFSKMEFFNDSRFFFRSFADAALRLRSEYNKEITKNTNVGILFQKQNRDYVLVPSTLIGTILDTTIEKDCIYDPTTNTWKLYSGRMPFGKTAKKYNYEIEGRRIDDPAAIPISWNDEMMKEYREDLNRKGLNVLQDLKSKPKYKLNGIPVFYQTDDSDEISSFGNTKNYRMPYHMTVSDHLSPKHIGIKKISSINEAPIESLDFVNMIFGKTDDKNDSERTLATRVYFEDAICNNETYEEKCLPKILGSPRPTSFQLYLEQPNGVKTAKSNLLHWNDSTAIIRGFKQYWHKFDPFGYKEDPGVKKSLSHPDHIKPLKPGNTFIGKIRFENLTNAELGALLFALELPDNCCHKIGMCKPYGLGTIRITPTLTIENRLDRYSSLIDASGKWHLPNVPIPIDYKRSFSQIIIKGLKEEVNDLWETARLKHLKSMLEFDENLVKRSQWLGDTNYMTLQEFKKRDVLDTPVNILNKFKNDLHH